MNMRKGVATWLEIAVAPDWRREAAEILVHRIAGCERECHALTMDGRWLCNNDGRLTVFDGEAAVARFLGLVRIDNYEKAAESEAPGREGPGWYCLGLCMRGLSPCRNRVASTESRPAMVTS